MSVTECHLSNLFVCITKRNDSSLMFAIVCVQSRKAIYNNTSFCLTFALSHSVRIVNILGNADFNVL